MAWTSPITWVAGQILTAAQLNQQVRDNETYLYGQTTTLSGQTSTLLSLTSTLQGRKNALTNGVGFPINQRAAASYSATGYTVDRWLHTLGSGASSTITPTTPVPGTTAGFIKQYLAWTRTVAGTTATTLEQRLESASLFAGQTVSVSFYAWCASGTVDFIPSIVQNVTVPVTTTGSTITATTTPTLYTATIAVPSISGKTLNAAATDYVSLVISRPTTGNGPTVQLNISAVQLELGSAGTAFEVPTIQETLAQCQRYYYRQANTAVANQVLSSTGNAATATSGNALINLPVPMRATPTLGTGGTINFTDRITAPAATGITVGATSSSNQIVDLAVTVAAGLTAGRPMSLQAASAASYLEFIAEL